jgi:hypothetical protein
VEEPEPAAPPEETMMDSETASDSLTAEPSTTPSPQASDSPQAGSEPGSVGGGGQPGTDQDSEPSTDPEAEPPANTEPLTDATPASDAGGDSNQASPDVATDASDPTAEEVQDACFAVAGDDPCENCVCESCVEQLDECAATAGCPEILECVLESGCTGLACYCGDEPLWTCVAGQGNGPCRDAVLSAPGGRQPTVLNPSGGPASDAALAVSDCSADANTCGDVCDTATE